MPRLFASSAVLAATFAAIAPAAAEPTTPYVVKEGDTCLGIAIRVLGDRTAYNTIHRLNPQLGKLPHLLKPGQVLTLPVRRDDPDARLTGTSGDVRVRRPDAAWDAARRGMDLFRQWRVGAEARASAEVTFSDTRRLYLREHTIVVIYGPDLGRAKLTTTEAVLERGTLRTRLAELSGGTVNITTPTAVAALGTGSALVTVDESAASTVANHEGKPVELRGKAGGKVAVASGMGSRVKRGKPPEKPRPLPPSPEWQAGLSHHIAALIGPALAGEAAAPSGATVRATWFPVAKAAWYRLEISGASGVAVFAAEVPHTVTSLELRDVPPGSYTATVAAIDADRFEGKPGEPLTFTVAAVAFARPGAAPAVATAAPDPDAPLPPPSDAAAPAVTPVVAIGTTLGDAQTTCEAFGREGAPLALISAGPATVACTTPDGTSLEPFAVEVADVTAEPVGGPGAFALDRGAHAELEVVLRSAAPLGDHWHVEPGPGLAVTGLFTAEPRDEAAVTLRIGVTAADGAPATSHLTLLDATSGARVLVLAVTVRGGKPVVTEVTPHLAGRGRPAFTAGAYTGYTWFPTGTIEGAELGDPALDDYQVDSGAGAGMRTAWWPRRDLFVEADLALVPTGFIAADEPAWIAAGHVYVGLQAVDQARFGVRGLLGAGGYALLGDAAYARADVDADVAYGVAATLRLTRDLALRFDARQHIAPDRGDGGVTDVLEATLGIEAVVTRTSAR